MRWWDKLWQALLGVLFADDVPPLPPVVVNEWDQRWDRLVDADYVTFRCQNCGHILPFGWDVDAEYRRLLLTLHRQRCTGTRRASWVRPEQHVWGGVVREA